VLRVLSLITHRQKCSLAPNALNLVLVSRADLFNNFKNRFSMRAADRVAPPLDSVLAADCGEAAKALAHFIQLETSVRAAGATARACAIWQNGIGFRCNSLFRVVACGTASSA
jgi:hypothetical protein